MVSKLLLTALLLLNTLKVYVQNRPAGTFSDSIKVRSSINSINIKRYAVVIGISNYIPPIPSLSYAELDAYRFKQFLESGYAGNFDQIKYLPDAIATYPEIDKEFFLWLEDLSLKKNDELYIYYSGHGVVKNGEQFFLAADSKIKDPNLLTIGRALSANRIKEQIRQLVHPDLGVKVVFIVDACRKNVEDLSKNTDYAEYYRSSMMEQTYGEMQMLSASKKQFSYETSGLKFEHSGLSRPNLKPLDGSSIFSYFLLLGLYGAADKKLNNEITFSELSDFVKDNVRNYVEKVLQRDENDKQEPNFYAEDVGFPLSKLPPDTARKYQVLYQQLRTKIDAGYGYGKLNITNQSKYLFSYQGFPAQTSGVSAPVGNRHLEIEEIQANNLYGISSLDTSDKKLFDEFNQAIDKKHLIKPEGKSAFSFFHQLNKLSTNKDLIRHAKGKLFSALINHSQDLIDVYLEGKLKDFSRINFLTGYEELLAAEQLVSTSSPYRKVVFPKQRFLFARALASSSNPKDWDQALLVIDSALRIEADAAYNHHTKALLFNKQNKYSSAIKSFERAIQLAPMWAYPTYSLALCYYNLGQYDKSINYCFETIKRDSAYAHAYSLIALNYENSKLYDSAIYWNNKAIAADSSTTDAYYFLGRIYRALKDKASRYLDLSDSFYHIGAIKYGDNDCYYQIAQRLEEKKKTDSAFHYYKKILESDSFYVDAYEALAYLLSNRGDTCAGDSMMRYMLGKMSSDGASYSKYAYYMMQYHSPEIADSLYRVALLINKEDPAVYLDHAYLLEYKKKNYTKAKAILHEGLAFMGNNSKINYALANFYYRRSKDSVFFTYALDSAIYYYKKVKALVPEYAFAYIGLYNAFLAIGNLDSAMSYLHYGKKLNKFFDSLVRFNVDFLGLADEAIKKGKYLKAIEYYSILYTENPQNYNVLHQISLCYYLLGNTDSAYKRCLEAQKLIDSRRDEMDNKELAALILFDMGQYDASAAIFQKLHDDYGTKIYSMEYMISLYKAKRFHEVEKVLLQSFPEGVVILEIMTRNEGLKYSSTFINELKETVYALQTMYKK